MSGHTPGPWEAVNINPKYNELAVRGNGLILATHTFAGKEAEANARLMAAAPDMLRELKHFCKACAVHMQDRSACRRCRTGKVIKGAEGDGSTRPPVPAAGLGSNRG